METLLKTSEFQDVDLPPSWTSALFDFAYNVIIHCVALSYSSDDKREERESFWKLLASSISSNKSR